MPFSFAPVFLVFVGREVLGARPGAAWVPGYLCVGGKVCVVRVVCMNAHKQPEAVMNVSRSRTPRTRKSNNTHKHAHAKCAKRTTAREACSKLPAGSPRTCKRHLPAGASHKGVGLHTHLHMGNSWHTRTRTPQRETVDTHAHSPIHTRTRDETQRTHHAQHTETQHAPQTATRGYPTQSRTGSQPEGRQARRASLYITGCGRYRWRVVCVHPRPRRARPGCALPLACGVFPC